jgi:segregation and condensation protein B
MERSLIKITGKARVLGAPFLYGTTPEFLEYLGLNSLRDLPSLEELEALLEKEAHPESALDETGASEDTPEPVGAAAEEADELYEATAAEVAAAMAAVNEARGKIPRPEKTKGEASGTTPGSTETDGEDPAVTGAAARIGPAMEEPVNQPVDPTPAQRDEEDERPDPDEEAVKVDEREDER